MLESVSEVYLPASSTTGYLSLDNLLEDANNSCPRINFIIEVSPPGLVAS